MTTLIFSAALGPAFLAAVLLLVRNFRSLPAVRYLAALLVVMALLFANVISLDMRGRNLLPHLGFAGGLLVAGLLWRLSLVSKMPPVSVARQTFEAAIMLALASLAAWWAGMPAGLAILLMQVAAVSTWRWGWLLGRIVFGRTMAMKTWIAMAAFALSVLVAIAALQAFSEQLAAQWMAHGLIPAIPILLVFVACGLILSVALERAKKPRRIAKPILDESEARHVQVQLRDAVIGASLFRNSALQVADVVAVTGLPAESLREAVRRSGAANFFDYVNRARINASCEALVATNEPVSQILLDAGFHSPSSFYTEFRKRVGSSPTDYRRRMRIPARFQS